MRQIETTIEIAAPAARVWEILTDFTAYPAWNPFITRVRGEAAVGARLSVRIVLPGRRPMRFRPVVTRASRPHELSWRGRFLLPGLLTGEHSFRLEGHDGACRFTHAERFTGLLSSLAMSAERLGATRAGFDAMNKALKSAAERGRS